MCTTGSLPRTEVDLVSDCLKAQHDNVHLQVGLRSRIRQQLQGHKQCSELCDIYVWQKVFREQVCKPLVALHEHSYDITSASMPADQD